MTTEKLRKSEQDRSQPANTYHKPLAVLISISVVIYTVGVISGLIPEERRIDSVNLAIIAFAVLVVVLLLRPQILDRLKLLEMTGFKVEMLEEVKEKQAEQESRLEDIALILPLLLPVTERKHLLNLADGKTSDYKGNHSLRTELRRLRSIGLIKMLSGKHVGDVKDGLMFNLADYVELTDDLGERWVKRIKEIEQAEISQKD